MEGRAAPDSPPTPVMDPSDSQRVSPWISIRAVLLVPFALLVLITVGLTGWFSIQYGRGAVNEMAHLLKAETSTRIVEKIRAFLAVPPLVNEINENALVTRRLDLDDPQSWQPFFWRQMKAFPSITMSFVGTPDGLFRGSRRLANGELNLVKRDESTQGNSHYFSVDQEGLAHEPRDVFKNFDPRVRPWYQAALKAQVPVWSPVYRHFVIPDLAITAARPAYDRQGRLLAVFGVDYVLSGLHQFLREQKIGLHGMTFIMERTGDLISTSTPDPVFTMVDNRFSRIKAQDSVNPVLAQTARVLAASSGGLSNRGAYQEEVIVDNGHHHVEVAGLTDGLGLDWLVVVVIPESDFMGEIQANTRITIILMAGALILSLLAGTLTARWIALPILRLNRTARDLALGRWTRGPEIGRRDEVGQLARSFNQMAGQLRTSFESLEAKNALIAEHNRELELKVRERTAEISSINQLLQAEIEEKRATADNLAQAHGQLRAIFDGFPGLIHVIDRDYTIVDVSDKMIQALNLPDRPNILGRKCYEVYQGLSQICPNCLIPKAQETSGPVSRVSLPEEEARLAMAYKIYSAPILDRTGKIWGYVECIMDISDLRAMELELLQAKEAAEAANLAKSYFLANMSHEIRTPMSGLLGITDLLSESPLSEDQRSYLNLMRESGRQLLDIINDILDLSKIEAGRFELNPVDFRLAETIESINRLFANMAVRKGLAYEVRLSSELPDRVCGDPIRLRQVLINLLGNAVKFTESGRITLAVETTPDARLEQDTAGEPSLHFMVEDTGIGIPTDKQEMIFDSFSQADGSAARKFQGTGLGLAISKRIVEMMGGTIWVVSQVGQGSAFHFTARLGPGVSTPKEAGGERESPPVSRPLAILVAEDHPVNQVLIQRLLTKKGHRVTLAPHGRMALETWRRENFDCILMDIQMPELDGIEATRIIRESAEPGGKARVPIIALTAHALTGDRERFLAAGMNGYITKPVDIEELLRVIREVMAAHETLNLEMETKNTL